MKDRVIRLGNNIRIYTLDELTYKDKKYVFGVEVDDNDDVLNDKTHCLEVNINDEKLIVNEIEDFETASVVSNLFLARLAEEE